MGRYTTGATHTDGSKRISISFLKQQGYLEQGRIVKGNVTFSIRGNPTGSISISTDTTGPPFMQLTYTHTNHQTEEKTDLDYKIMLVKVPSNLGRGFRYYFQCPVSGKRCTTLYMAYGSQYFKHREAYQHRIYYPVQMEPKRYRCFQYHAVKAQLDELYKKQKKSHYRGNKTRLAERIERLETKYYKLNEQAELLLMGAGYL